MASRAGSGERRVAERLPARSRRPAARLPARRWGHTRDGVSLAPYYQACVRMVRADYCGDGVEHTRNGTPVDIFDRVGVQKDEPAPPLSFEAAWGPEGAICADGDARPDLPAPGEPHRRELRRGDPGPALRPLGRRLTSFSPEFARRRFAEPIAPTE